MSFTPNTQNIYTQYGLAYGWSTFNQRYTISGMLNQSDLVAYLNANIPTIGTLIGDQYTFNDITSDTDNQLRNSLNTYTNTFTSISIPDNWTPGDFNQTFTNGVSIEYQNNDTFLILGVLDNNKFV